MSKKEEVTELQRPTSYDPHGLETVTIQADWWSEDMTVTIQELTYAKREQIGGTGVDPNRKVGKKNPLKAKDFDTGRLQTQFLVDSVISWTFKDKSGKAIPLNRGTLGGLRSRDGDFIMEAIDALNEEHDDDFPKGSS